MPISWREVNGKIVICNDGVFMALKREQISQLKAVALDIECGTKDLYKEDARRNAPNTGIQRAEIEQLQSQLNHAIAFGNEEQRREIEQLRSQLASEKSKSASCLAEFLSSKSRSDQAYIDGIVDAWNHIYCVVEDKDAEIDRKRLALVDMIKVDNEQMKQIQSLTERNKQLEDSIKQWIGNPTTGNEWTMRDLINTPTNKAGG